MLTSVNRQILDFFKEEDGVGVIEVVLIQVY